MGGGIKRGIGKARRRVTVRSALLLMLGALAITALWRLMPGAGMPQGMRQLLDGCVSLLVFGGGAYLGLCVLDGDHRRLLPLRQLSRAQMLPLALLGALAVFPAAMMENLVAALLGAKDAAGAAGMRVGAMTIVRSVMIAPLAEELFFRGYLLGGLRRFGAARAAAVSALCFALAHAGGFVSHALLGALLGFVMIRTDSILAPVLVHAMYNLTLLALGGAGLGAALGTSLAACALQLAFCAAFAAMLKKACRARGTGSAFALWPQGESLSRREKLLLGAALALVLAAAIAG